MIKAARNEMISLFLLLICCSMKQLSFSFIIPSKFTGKVSSNPKLFSVNEVVEGLEKRLKNGKLSSAETNEMIDAIDSLMENLDTEEKEEAPLPPAQYDDMHLRSAVSQLDANAVSNMLKAGLKMDEETVDAAFWAVVNEVDRAEVENEPLSADVTRMIHHIFDADMQLLLEREKITTNVTCMQPDDSGGLAAAARRINYVFDDGDHKNLPLMEGRKCEGGTCCDKCSRNIFPTFALDNESNLDTFSDIKSLTFNDLEKVATASILQFVRLIERVRRTIAYEYGLPLKIILPLQAYSRKYVAGTTQQGGGGGEGDFVILHTDEATHTGYHYSCVLYLSTQGEDFEGGNFVFNDPAKTGSDECDVTTEECNDDDDDDADALLEAFRNGELPDKDFLPVDEKKDESEYYSSLEDEIRRAGRELTPFSPTRGSAVIFSSGWENMHEVEKITSGTRYAVPCFFTTCPVPDMAYEQMNVGKPKTDEDIADDWLHLLLAHRKEEPAQAVGRVKELLMKWHVMCTPLSEH